jgi:cytochrome o ubiquinol oxidase operon protein cyoD
MTLKKYSIGFIASLFITLIAYNMVVGQLMTGLGLMVALGILALIQMIIQLVFFLHLDEESGPRYKLAAFGFMTGILVLVVVGSLWIMHHLNYNMMHMTTQDKNDYMTTQKDKGF